MSWNVVVAGPAAEVAVKFEEKIQATLVHQSEAVKAILLGHVAQVKETCAANADHTIIAESQGHLDSGGGSADLKVRKLWN